MEFLHTLESIRSPFGDAFFVAATGCADEILFLTLIMLLYWCIDKKLAYRMLFGYMFSALCVNILKLVFRIERPWVRDPSLKPVEKALKGATGYSFPSGHTQNAVAMYGTIAYNLSKSGTEASHNGKHKNENSSICEKWVIIPCVLIILLVLFSRMYLGVHTPEDVLVSLILSSVIIIGLNIAADRITLDGKKRLVIAVFMLAVAAATLSYAIALYLGGYVEYAQIADVCKGCGAGFAFAICWYVESVYIGFDEKAAPFWMQAVKFVIGAAGVLVVRNVIKSVFGSNPVSDTSRYFLMMLWAMLIMPLVIKKYFTKK
ncbi:MAG: phosphatase PAP2 family protein [Lachnospiraceae bacterium]|nr:phosphatase PAP2 family protein [Lachnospiraceae bacterium]